MTNNSLAASQRPYISLIDRRLSDARRVPYRVRFNGKTCLARKQGSSSPLDTFKPYQRRCERRASEGLAHGMPLKAHPFDMVLCIGFSRLELRYTPTLDQLTVLLLTQTAFNKRVLLRRLPRSNVVEVSVWVANSRMCHKP